MTEIEEARDGSELAQDESDCERCNDMDDTDLEVTESSAGADEISDCTEDESDVVYNG